VLLSALVLTGYASAVAIRVPQAGPDMACITPAPDRAILVGVALSGVEAIADSRTWIEEDQAMNGVNILRSPGDPRDTTIAGGRRDQCGWQTGAALLAPRDGPLPHGLVQWDVRNVSEPTHRLLSLVRALWVAQAFDPAHHRDDRALCDPGLALGEPLPVAIFIDRFVCVGQR
jgi:hypothetical protein